MATVFPSSDVHVQGVLYELDAGSLAALDRHEGHPHVYRRRQALIHSEGRRARRAYVYCLREYLPPTTPRTRYFLTILKAYREWGFNEEALIRAALDV